MKTLGHIASHGQEIDPCLVGGKAHNLLWLKQNGANVPDFFVLTTHSYEYFLRHKCLPNESENALFAFLDNHKDSLFAVRSSVTGEDGDEHSFAGLFETFLNCSRNEVLNRITDAYNSLNSARVLEYTRTKNITLNLSMALVIQKMSPSIKSGVAFSRSPISPTSLVVIDAGLGLGEGVVSGHVEVETIRLTRLFEVISSTGPEILNKHEKRNIAEICLELEERYGSPCDIEWSITEENKLNILQIRPITQTFEKNKYLADTNLTESYPGSVSPFTGLFVKRSYENVFIESALALGASQERLKELSVHYAQLIAVVNNHLYYDLEHYYAILRALPGGEKNIENWHQMIGGKFDGAKIPKHGSPLGKIETIGALSSLLNFIISHKKIFQGLTQTFANKKLEEEKKIASFKNSKEAFFYLTEMIETRFDFGLTIVNDVLVMMGLGLLKKRIPHLTETELMSLLKTEDEVTSVKPLFALENLAKNISRESLDRLLTYKNEDWINPYQKFFEQELSRGEIKSVELMKTFLDNFGDRSFEELKLESLTFKQDPTLLAQTLKWMGDQKEIAQIPHSKRSHTQEYGIITNFIIAKTRSAIEVREETRLWRGKFYNLIREAIIKAAQLLKEEDSLWNEFELKDFFSVNHSEWRRFSTHELSPESIRKLMIERQGWKTENRKFPEFLVWTLNEELPNINQELSDNELRGTGVSMGIVQGRCLVIEKPEEAFNIKDIENYILVTKNTDPAWVFIMSKSKGLISEKGSLLSHTAIIGRELKIPTIVGVKSITQKLKTGDIIEMNPETGLIKII